MAYLCTMQNELFAATLGPPAYFDRLTIEELSAHIDAIKEAMRLDLTNDEFLQLQGYYCTYTDRLNFKIENNNEL